MNYINRFYQPIIYAFVLLNIALNLQAAQFEKPTASEEASLPPEFLYGKMVTVPTKEILEKRLGGFSDLLQHSNLLEMAGKTKFESEIPFRVRESIEKYRKAGGQPMRIAALKSAIPYIVGLIESNPQSIKLREEQLSLIEKPREKKI